MKSDQEALGVDQTAEINGNLLRYKLAGKGPLAVVSHGLLGSIEQFEAASALLDQLQGLVRLLVYDARGHGRSTGPEVPDGYSWETLGTDMAAWLDETGDETAIFGGASMGAATALWVALERPELVRALILAMPPPLGPDSMRTPEERQAIQLLETLATAIDTFGLQQTVDMARQFPGFAATPEEAEERAAWLGSQNASYIVHAIRGLVAAEIHDPAKYSELKVPILVLAHDGDGLHPVRAAELIKEMAPHAVLRVAPDPGHWQTHPDEFVGEVKTFIAEAL